MRQTFNIEIFLTGLHWGFFTLSFIMYMDIYTYNSTACLWNNISWVFVFYSIIMIWFLCSSVLFFRLPMLDRCSNISTQTKLFIFNLQNHYRFGMYAWNLPYCEVLTLGLCTTSVWKKVDLKLHLISACSWVHTEKISGLRRMIKLQGMSVFPHVSWATAAAQ